MACVRFVVALLCVGVFFECVSAEYLFLCDGLKVVFVLCFVLVECVLFWV